MEQTLHATEPSGNMWLDLTGALRHHPLNHLVHLVVHLDQAQVDFGDAMDMVALLATAREPGRPDLGLIRSGEHTGRDGSRSSRACK